MNWKDVSHALISNRQPHNAMLTLFGECGEEEMIYPPVGFIMAPFEPLRLH